MEIDSISEAGGRPTLTFVTPMMMEEGYKNRWQVAGARRFQEEEHFRLQSRGQRPLEPD